MTTIAEHRRARFDYEILDTLEAGISLTGQETKSAKAGRLNLTGSYVLIRGSEAWLTNASLPPYQPGNTPDDYDPARTRRLLLHKEEIKKLTSVLKDKSISLIPLNAHVSKNLVKLTLGIARNRKKSDKRELIKRRDVDREAQRSIGQ